MFEVSYNALCPRFVFPSTKFFSQKPLPNLVEKTKLEYVLPKLEQCYLIITANFNLWMSKGAHDIFSLVINLLKVD
jgi:hypothetical protein